MLAVNKVLLLTIFLAISCNTNAADICTSVGASYYYQVTHIDMRKCMAPMCGGYFVKQVNQLKSLCADGVWRDECHVFQLDAKPLNWTEAQTDEYFNQVFGQGTGIIRGNFPHALDVGTQSPLMTPDTLTVAEAWQAQGDKPSVGLLYHVKDTGIVCITTPCLDDTIEQVTNLWDKKDKMINGVSLEASGASQDQINLGYQTLSQDGILVAGRHKSIAAGKAQILVASQFYLPMKVTENTACTANTTCPVGQVADAKGVCQLKPEICTMDYVPVCGCDGVTYGNDCARMAAGAQFDHVGECLLMSQ